MKQLQKLTPFIIFALIGVLGCEHDLGSDTTDVGGGPITFTGNYAPASGHGAVVEVTNVVVTAVIADASETIGTGDGVSKSYTFTASYLPIVPGTVQITDGIERFIDVATSATNGTLYGSSAGLGTIEYATGNIKVRFTQNVVFGGVVAMTYQYVAQGVTVDSPMVTHPITVLSVTSSNKIETKLTLTDNNGRVYSGTGSGIVAPDATSSPQQFSVSATFSVTGSNVSNQYVAIDGSFSANYDSGVLKNRRITGTYREFDGARGNVQGSADDINVGPIVTTNSLAL
jgi:hypothetical protein